jgi:hypothetical protein
MERIGTLPISLVLGALCQIQGYTLHLDALDYRLVRFILPNGILLSG